MSQTDVFGPVDYVMIEFPRDSTGAETAKALGDLVDSGTVRLYDVMVVSKDEGGGATEIDLSNPSDGQLTEWRAFAGARSGLLDDDDVARAAEVLGDGKVAAVVLYENAWAVPFVSGARNEGGQMVASARLTAQEIMDALDAAEAGS